ncbi:DNA-binding response regulator, AraC family, partial [hydrothermal vent metagenome]
QLKKRIAAIPKDSLYPVQHYDTLAGLPSIEYNDIFYLDKKIYALNSSNGIYRFDKKSQLFSKDTFLMNQYDTTSVTGFYNSFGTDKDDVWHITGDNDGVRKIFNLNGNQISELPESKLFNNLKTFHIYEADSIVFFSGPKGIIAYNRRMKIPKSKFHPVQLRKVFIKNDSLVYAGKNATSEYNFPYKQNAVQFEYSLPYYTKPEKNEYQYILEGFDQDWSKWSLETKNNYTNIAEGTYTFKVRAKNLFGEISKEDSYVFTVLPPWYRSWWAYFLYILGAVLTIILFSQWRSKQLRAKNLALEKTVANRTEEISEKNVQLESQTERLKELDTMKTRLFANISHEFRTPLTLIKGPIEKLEETQKNTISTTNIKMIRRNANRLLNLVNQLLDLSKLDSGKLRLNVAEGDVFKCVRTAASSFGSHAASRNIDYRIKIPSRPLWGSFDRDKIEKIMYNLLSNAFKFTADEGKISITASFRHNQLELKVSDTGSGIAAEKLPHIYDRFFQVDDSYTREKAGSGIGLALTKELVQLMNGKIYVESELGKGTRFKVHMPIEEIKSYQKDAIQEKPIAVFENEDEKPTSTVSNKRTASILIIEDNNDMRHFIREQLIQDYDIFEAPNGKEGLKKATKLMPDLIITDLMMPQMDGITLCKKLKTNIATSHIPVIMLTAKAGIENKLEGLETGADDYLTKPFNAKELQVRTKNLIAQRQQLRELFSKNISLDPKEITVTSLDNKFLEQVLGLLEEKHADSEFGVPRMQEQLGMGKTRLHTKIKALTDQPPGELLRNFRLKRAAQLLSQNAENISQVAYSVGFNSLSYFTRCFKEFYGMSPSEYVKKGK